MAIAMRKDIEVYMNMAAAASAETDPIWVQCGSGWTKFSENPNAQTESVQYINQASETTDTTSYAPQYAFECDLMHTEPSVKKVYDICKDRKTGSDAVIDVLIVDKFEKGSTEESFVARREKLAVAVTSIDGTKKMKMTGNLNGQGDGVKGDFVPAADPKPGETAGTFTEKKASTETT